MINNSWIDGYKTLFITFISILIAGCVYFFSPETASLIQQILQQCVLPLGIIILGIVANGVIAQYTRAKILSVPPGLRRMVNITPINGWEPIIDAIGTLTIAVITGFIKNYGQAATLSQLVSSVFVPLAMLIIGGQAISLHVSQNKLKLAPVNAAAITTGNIPAPLPPIPAPPVPQPPIMVASEDYLPIDIDALVAKADAQIQKNGGKVTDLARAYNFTSLAEYIDCFSIPKEYRISEFIRLCKKCLELFNTAFTSYTQIKTPPTPDQVKDYWKYQFQLKKDYMAANNTPCGTRTFDELKRLILQYNELYGADYGLAQESGKVCDWSIYGTGGTTHGFVEIGQDWVELTT